MLNPAEIRRLRERIGWSARELARRASVSVQWVSDVEAGNNQNPGWRHLASVEQAFREALVELGQAMGIGDEEAAQPARDGAEAGFVLLSRDDVLRRQLGISDDLMRELLAFRMNGSVKTIEDAVPHALAARAALERAARPAGQ
jgi:transcriptional regulator with XRE-family HTH domain